MTGFSCKKAENCFSASETYAYALTVPMDEGFIARLEKLGELQVKRNLRRPFFFLDLADGTEAKGVLDDDVMKVSFPANSLERSKAEFEAKLALLLENADQKTSPEE